MKAEPFREEVQQKNRKRGVSPCMCVHVLETRFVLLQLLYDAVHQIITESWTTSLCYLEGLNECLNGRDATPSFIQPYSVLHTQFLNHWPHPLATCHTHPLTCFKRGMMILVRLLDCESIPPRLMASRSGIFTSPSRYDYIQTQKCHQSLTTPL